MKFSQSHGIISILTFVFAYSNPAEGFSIHSNQLSRRLLQNPPKPTSSRLHPLSAYPPRKNRGGRNNQNNNEEGNNSNYDPILDEPEGKRGDGRNWIEKSSPTGIGKLDESTSTENSKATETDGNYDLGIDGVSFQTGPLSTRMYEALSSVALKRFPPGTTALPDELNDVYKLYTMDITAKEAVKAALDQNGMQLAFMNEDDPQSQDEGMWGDVENVKLMDMDKADESWLSEVYDNLDDAVEEGGWTPGQPFSFVVRNVPAKLKEMDVSELLAALDPDGEYRAEANEKGITLPDEDITSLKSLGLDCERRTRVAPMETYSTETVYTGNDSKGYNSIKRSDLLADSRNADGSENNDVLMHVMDSMVNHGCLIVDISDGGASFLNAQKVAGMWNVADNFFNLVENDDKVAKALPGMKTAAGAKSPNAVVGFESYNDGAMQFLETRIVRNVENEENTEIEPKEVVDVVGSEDVKSLIKAFDLLCDIGKDVVRVAVAAANMEHDGFLDEDGGADDVEQSEVSDLPFISGLTFEEAELTGVNQDGESDTDPWIVAEKLSSDAALKLVDNLIDDGKNKKGNNEQGRVNLSPHRLCKYVDNRDGEKQRKSPQTETFGAHTDTSFVTIVPVSSMSGLEVFDEAANKWFRPELLAKQKWEAECAKRGVDASKESETFTINENGNDIKVEIPWHSRYICVMPGELLQVCTRNEVPATVHRVVSATNEGSRLSAPVLLRARAGMKLNVEEYFGNSNTIGQLLDECDGLNMEEIHDRLQPSSYRS